MNFISLDGVRHLPVFNKAALVLINFIVGALILTVFNHDRFKAAKSRIFVGMGVLMLLWVDFAYLARLYGTNMAVSEVFLRIAWVATPMLFYFTFLISVYLLEVNKDNKKINYFLFGLAILLSSITAFSDLVIKSTTFTGGTLDIVYGSGFYPFMLGIFLFMVFTLLPLFKAKLNRGTLGFLVGVIIFYVANLIFNIALPVFWGVTHFYYLGDYSTIFLLGFTTYAVLRHELFDIKVAAAEVITGLIWIMLFAKIFFSQSPTETVIDVIIFLLALIFGMLLIRSVISEVRQREKLQELTEKLRALDKQKDEFISMAAHELRAPTTAVKGYISMILEGDAGDIPDKAKDFLTDAAAINDRLIRLVNNMLSVSRIERGRLSFQFETKKLSKIADSAYRQFKLEAERKGLKFSLEIPPKKYDDTVFVDEDRLHEVVANFISNAIKYTEEGFVAVKIKKPRQETIRLEVEDSGPGISVKEQDKLFQKFYRVESTVGKTIGTGLGLYISKLIIERFGGTIGVDSKKGKGSIFWFELPLKEEGKKQLAEDEATKEDKRYVKDS
jgi:signal transduction histidine kinase